MKVLCAALFGFLLIPETGLAQIRLPDKCQGVWKGTLHIYSAGILKDSVAVRLTIARREAPNEWTWKMEYLSPKQPMVKDYVLRHKEGNRYVMDEGGGVELPEYEAGNTLYSLFEVQGNYLTSTLHWTAGRLIFEVTSGKMGTPVAQGINVFSVDYIQRAVLTPE